VCSDRNERLAWVLLRAVAATLEFVGRSGALVASSSDDRQNCSPQAREPARKDLPSRWRVRPAGRRLCRPAGGRGGV